MSQQQNEEVNESEETLDEVTETDGAEEEEEDQEVAIRACFDEQVVAEADEDDIKLAMIGIGATFKNVTRLFNKFMIDAGFALSKEDKSAHVTDSLEGLEFESEEDYDKAVVALISDEKGINERSASGLLRAYAKKNGLEIYKKPKSDGAGKSGFASTYYDWLIANPTVTEEACKAYIMDTENSGNVHNHLSHYQNIRQLVNDVAAQYAPSEEPTPDAS